MAAENKFTPAPWTSPIWSGDEEFNLKADKMGIARVPALTNDGCRFVMAENRRVALVDCATDFKRGKGYQTECAERDANARLISAAPELLAAIIRLRDLPVDCSQQEDVAAWEQAHAAISKATQ